MIQTVRRAQRTAVALSGLQTVDVTINARK